jgi:anti-anti-sigma factor
MEITVSTEKRRVPIAVMHVSGNVDSSTYEAFQRRAEELIQQGSQHILVDLENTPLVTSAGLRALNNIFNRLRAAAPDMSDEDMKKGINAGTYKSPHLKLLKPSKASSIALENSGFSMFLEIYEDTEKALKSF